MKRPSTIAVAFCLASLPIAAFGQADRTESALWDAIQKLTSQDRESAKGEIWYAKARENRTALLEKIRLSQVLYPGGTHRDELISLELQARFEIAIIDNGDFAPLAERVKELLTRPVSRAAEEEAAYWQMHVDVQELLAKSADFDASKQQNAGRTRKIEFVGAYPQSPRVPFLVRELMLACENSAKFVEITPLVAILKQHHPHHGLTRELGARLRLHESIGTEIPLELSASRGQPVLICFVDSRMPTTANLLEAVTKAAEARTFAIQVVDFAHDEMNSEKVGTTRENTAQRLRELGIVEVPTLLAVDGQRVLLGIASAKSWNELIDQHFPDTLTGTESSARPDAATSRPTEKN